ncbi:hypothetical protein nbrc107696_27950 [Gordonia spumicola]|uniref:ABC transporter permease n=1 Tax=Gordonia spumicola TaxID=589161 RepID=A0A7I9VAJ5_9ACTN|nr:hypothetical protein [Gordonia spumicola]GEE02349.1 hypothetical protein nbrc107696_27950 [Gordonia spumicola]
MSASPTPALPLKTIASHVVVPALMGVVMALCYLGGFHKPDPHELRIDVVGPPAVTARVSDALSTELGDKVDLGQATSVDDARTAIENREIVAAFVPGADVDRLLVSTAAGDPTAMVAERIFSSVSERTETRLVITDVVPADPVTDPSGQSLFFLLVALTVGSYGTGIAIAVAAGGRSMGVRLAFAAAAAVLVPAAVVAVAAMFDALPGAGSAVFGLGVPYALATMLFAIGLHPLIGRFTTIVMVTIFVGLNFTTSGGVFAPALQPAFFGALHDFWIGAGFNEAARDLAYFPHLSVTGELGKLVGWLVAGCALVAVAAVVERRRRTKTVAAVEPSFAQLEELEEEVVA